MAHVYNYATAMRCRRSRRRPSRSRRPRSRSSDLLRPGTRYEERRDDFLLSTGSCMRTRGCGCRSSRSSARPLIILDARPLRSRQGEGRLPLDAGRTACSRTRGRLRSLDGEGGVRRSAALVIQRLAGACTDRPPRQLRPSPHHWQVGTPGRSARRRPSRSWRTLLRLHPAVTDSRVVRSGRGTPEPVRVLLDDDPPEHLSLRWGRSKKGARSNERRRQGNSGRVRQIKERVKRFLGFSIGEASAAISALERALGKEGEAASEDLGRAGGEQGRIAAGLVSWPRRRRARRCRSEAAALLPQRGLRTPRRAASGARGGRAKAGTRR